MRDSDLPRSEKIFARLPMTTVVKIDEMAKHWGPVKPLSTADVLIEAIERIYHFKLKKEQEAGPAP